MAPPGEVKPNQLPAKENAYFKRIVKCYEQKMYKNGLKFSKSILSNPKFSEHGETLAMKGLILNCLGRREEAHEHVRRGLKNDLRSHVCWHVYGLLQRHDKNYDAAIKAYQNALRWDPENIQILRDLSLLQMQLRDLEGYKETRYRLLFLRPSQRASWIGYAMCHHLVSDCDTAIQVLEEYCKAQPVEGYDYEHSELLLYQNMLYREAGRWAEALTHLTQNQHKIGDKLQFYNLKADLLIHLNDRKQAASIYRDLINRNPDNRGNYQKLEKCLGLDEPSNLPARMQLYDEVIAQHPRASLPKRLKLSFAQGPVLKELLAEYMTHGLRKGIPPLYRDLRPLYADPIKVALIEDFVTNSIARLKAGKGLDCEETEAPSVVLWAWAYLAQHHDASERSAEALALIDAAIEHTPTLIELYLVKAKIYKHAGALSQAVQAMYEAQSLDTADRYINSKCAKYILRTGMVPQAAEMCAKFTREGVGAPEHLNEMQCMWFQLECALAYKKLGLFGEALKKCHEIDRHFTEFIEDQLDFHTYCIRKMTLCAYVRLIRMEDTLRRHPFYLRCAIIAMKIYLKIHDSRGVGDQKANCPNGTALSAAELKKMRNKERKAAKKAEQAKELQKAVEAKAKTRQNQQPKEDQEEATVNQEALDPDKLLKTDSPLDDALRFFLPLLDLKCSHLPAYTLAFEIYYRKNKLLRMAQCLARALELCRAGEGEGAEACEALPFVQLCAVKFLKCLADAPPPAHGCAAARDTIVAEALAKWQMSRDPWDIVNRLRAEGSRSLVHALMAAQATCLLDPSQAALARSALAYPAIAALDGFKLKNVVGVWKCLRAGRLGPVCGEELAAFKAQSTERFPLADMFAPPRPPAPLATHDALAQDLDQLAE